MKSTIQQLIDETKKKKKFCYRKYYHKWEYYYDTCPSCGYEERCCKNCTVCEGKNSKGKWETVST